MKEKDYLLGLHHIKGVGSKTIVNIIQQLGSAKNVFEGSTSSIYRLKGIKQNVVHSIVENRDLSKINEIKKDLYEHGVKSLNVEDDQYPKNLKQIYDPPYLLYIKGNIIKKDENAVAIVGARKASSYGKYISYQLAKQLAIRGITVISGMAYGIDTAAHKGAIENGGRTIAVLGCGLDTCYPKSNETLMGEIVKNGAVISEYHLGIKPVAGNFPARNRIISGLSKGVIVVEAAKKSGSLITVEFALEQGREVFAVPGNMISTLSEGTNHLIQQGAKLIMNIEDVLQELNMDIHLENCCKKVEKNKNLSSVEEKIYQVILKNQPIHVDTLLNKLPFDTHQITSVITLLELKELIQSLPGNRFIAKIEDH